MKSRRKSTPRRPARDIIIRISFPPLGPARANASGESSIGNIFVPFDVSASQAVPSILIVFTVRAAAL